MSSVFKVWFCMFLCFVLLFFPIACYILLLIMFLYYNIVCVHLSLEIKRLLTYLLLEKITRTHKLTVKVKLTVLGVTFNSTLSFSQHVQNVTAKAATSLYALKTLKVHVLPGRALWEVMQATLVAQITYASPSWRGFIKAEVARLNAILLKTRRYGYFPADHP